MFLKSIRVENVRAIAESELDFDDESGGTRKWTLLLGENGTGKSTLLRCIASLLCGRDALPELLGRDPSSWIRSGQSNACSCSETTRYRRRSIGLASSSPRSKCSTAS